MRRTRAVLAGLVGLLFASAAQAVLIPGTHQLNGGATGDPYGAYTIPAFPNGGNNAFKPTSPTKISDVGLVTIDYSITGTEGFGAGSPRFYFVIDNNLDGFQDAGPHGGRVNVFFGHVPGLPASGTGQNFNIPSLYATGGGITLTPAEVAAVMDLYVSEIRIGNDGDHTGVYDNFEVHAGPLPEPASLGLLAAGAGLTLLRRKRA